MIHLKFDSMVTCEFICCGLVFYHQIVTYLVTFLVNIFLLVNQVSSTTSLPGLLAFFWDIFYSIC